MTTSRRITMRFALRAAAKRTLARGWLYLPTSEKPTLDTPCLLIDADPDDDTESIAVECGFPQEGLDSETIQDTAKQARLLKDPPTDELLLESFVYYWRFDSWLPSPGAANPPPWQETKKKLDLEFFTALGDERPDEPCRSEGCTRGAIHQSLFCRAHHYEMIKKEPCPFLE